MRIVLKIELPKEPGLIRLAVVLAQMSDGSFATYMMDVNYVEKHAREIGLSFSKGTFGTLDIAKAEAYIAEKKLPDIGFFGGNHFPKKDRKAAERNFCDRVQSKISHWEKLISNSVTQQIVDAINDNPSREGD